MTDIEAKLEQLETLGKRAIATKDAFDKARTDALEASRAYGEAVAELKALMCDEIMRRVGGAVPAAYECAF